MTCNDKCIHYPVCEQKNWDFANIDDCKYYAETFERPQGEWKLDSVGAYCSECHKHPDATSDFCPFCGADMRRDYK